MFTLLLGGARSGKSGLAVALAAASGTPVSFLATAELRPGSGDGDLGTDRDGDGGEQDAEGVDVGGRDAEFAQRIARHRAERPATWTTIEEPVDLRVTLDGIDPGETAVIDCLTLWVSNLLARGSSDEAVAEAAAELARAAGQRAGRTLVVSNEVGSGIVPVHPLARRYRDTLGRVNAIFAAHADEAFLVVAGRVLPLVPADLLLARGSERSA
jgi:adenosyl cobinamide kinase/adenosyl cobinamide phosphate guanylyltransferase